jgi:Zn-dependent protease
LDISSLLLAFAVVLASLTVHEWAHAWTADRLGDPTARMLGRVSFNPMVHIDLIGTILLPLIGMLSAGVIFGWAKPVPVNISRLPHPKRDFMIIAAAGPASNIAIACLAAAVFHGIGGWGALSEIRLASVLVTAVSINVLLAVFNMLPVPPLDGGNVLAGLLPDSFAGLIHTLRQYGFVILLALMVSGILGTVVVPIAHALGSLLL